MRRYAGTSKGPLVRVGDIPQSKRSGSLGGLDRDRDSGGAALPARRRQTHELRRARQGLRRDGPGRVRRGPARRPNAAAQLVVEAVRLQEHRRDHRRCDLESPGRVRDRNLHARQAVEGQEDGRDHRTQGISAQRRDRQPPHGDALAPVLLRRQRAPADRPQPAAM